jgi:hypothetical protein
LNWSEMKIEREENRHFNAVVIFVRFTPPHVFNDELAEVKTDFIPQVHTSSDPSSCYISAPRLKSRKRFDQKDQLRVGLFVSLLLTWCGTRRCWPILS